jgi:hypothetical protein
VCGKAQNGSGITGQKSTSYRWWEYPCCFPCNARENRTGKHMARPQDSKR